MAKWLFAAALGVCLASGAAGAADGPDFTPIPGDGGTAAAPGPLRSIQYYQSDWHPVGCVVSPHDCEHLAHARGHHHHRVVRDHHACPYEPHLVCLAAE